MDLPKVWAKPRRGRNPKWPPFIHFELGCYSSNIMNGWLLKTSNIEAAMLRAIAETVYVGGELETSTTRCHV